MAKVSLSKIVPVKKVEPITINIFDQVIEVQQYLPINDKLEMLEQVLSATLDDMGYFNPVKMEIFFQLYLIKYYTNISLTEKVMSDPLKTYDLLEINGVFDKVIAAMPDEEYNTLFDAAEDIADNIVKYLDSFLGVLKSVSQEQQVTSEVLDKASATLSNPEDMGLLKDILEKMG